MMISLKKITTLQHVVFGVLILSVLTVFGLSVKEIFLTTPERMTRAETYLADGKSALAERQLILVAADTHNPLSIQAAYMLGELYRTGADDVHLNGKKAESFLKQAADAGHLKAQYQLALMYDVGDKIIENKQQAVHYMTLAAAQKMPEAQYALGVFMERGYTGEPDMNQVISLYEQAAAAGYKNAMISLIAIYNTGYGDFPNNIEKSFYWQSHLDKSVQ